MRSRTSGYHVVSIRRWKVAVSSAWHRPTLRPRGRPEPGRLVAFTWRHVTNHPLLFAALSNIAIPMIAIDVLFHRPVFSGITEGKLK